MSNDITEWISRIIKPREELGGMPVCPFAGSIDLDIIDTDGSDINPPPWDFELIIYKLPDYYTIAKLFELAQSYNIKFPEMIFLPDHKDRDTFINSVQTNNGKYNLILCQWRDNLTKSREKLAKTGYYTYWSEDYLKEILST